VSFDNLRNTAHSLLETHSIADVISLVSNNLPIDTSTAFQESQEVAKMVTGSALRVDNLHPSAFLNLEGKQLNFYPAAKLAERPDDLSYFRFQCNLDGLALDRRVINAGEFSIQFCLALHLFHVKDGSVEEITSSARKVGRKDNRHSMESFMAELSDTYSTPRKLFQSKVRDEEDEINSKDDKGSASGGTKEKSNKGEDADAAKMAEAVAAKTTEADSARAEAMQALSPKMKMMYGKEEKGFKKGYCGPLNFFNTQHDFHTVFGLKPTMLSSNPMGSSNNGVKKYLENLEKLVR